MRRTTRSYALLSVLLAAALASSAVPAASAPIEAPVDDARIVIYKAERELILYSGDEVLRRFPIGLGFKPAGAKEREGDGATPEGDYRVVVKNPQSRYYLSLGIDYPNATDADRGLEAGLISEAEHRSIVKAARRSVRPPWDTALGGEIFIHGRGSGSDWTLGCVALDDPDMEELFAAVEVGTPVTVRP